MSQDGGEEKRNMKEGSADREARQIRRVAGYALLLNLVLAVMKGTLAVFSGSLAILASAVDSGTDVFASLIIYAGVRLSARTTKSFPLGLYKLENVASVVIALFIFLAGYEIAREVLSPAASLPDMNVSYVFLLLAATTATFLFGQYAMNVGRKTGSPTLMAEGRHRQVDVLSSLVVLISVSLSYFNVKFSVLGITIDQMGAALIIIFVLWAGWELLSDGMRVLLDASIDFDTLTLIRKTIENEPMIGEIRNLFARSAGRFCFIQATVTVKTQNLQRAHKISESIETKIRNEVPHVGRVLIHYEPEKKSHHIIALPLDDPSGVFSKHFGEAPYFGLLHLRTQDNSLEKQEIFENPHRLVKTGKGMRVAEWLVDKGIDHVVMKEDLSHKGPGYVLSNAGVTTHIMSVNNTSEVVAQIISEGL